jgi:hypothetical protein
VRVLARWLNERNTHVLRDCRASGKPDFFLLNEAVGGSQNGDALDQGDHHKQKGKHAAVAFPAVGRDIHRSRR